MKRYIQLFSTFLVLFIINSAHAQNRDDIPFMITNGEVSITPARFIGTEDKTTADLSGSFVAFLPGGGASSISFPSSSVTTSPNISFSLPNEPDVDSNGTVREIKFSFDQNVLKVSGSIDQRAFDGPLIEYLFTATPSLASFEPTNFYSARSDLRKCPSPMCGGYFIKKLNQAKTLCADGSFAKECYVASANFDEFGINSFPFSSEDTTPYIFKGEQRLEPFKGFKGLGVFEVSEAYKAVTDNAASGNFYGLENLGIVCITSPCFSYEAHLLNRKTVLDISGVDFSLIGPADDEVVDQALQDLADGEVVLISGEVRFVDGFAGIGRQMYVTQLYTPVASPSSIDVEPLTKCVFGYSFIDGVCQTPFGCEFPLKEQEVIGGAPIVDLETGEVTANVTTSCVEECADTSFLFPNTQSFNKNLIVDQGVNGQCPPITLP